MKDLGINSQTQSLLGSTVVFLLVALLYTYGKNWLKFSRLDVKCDFGVPVLGSHWRDVFNVRSWHETLKHLYYKHVNERFVVMFEIGGRPEYLIRDPALVKQIAVRDFSSFVNRIPQIHPSTDPMLGNELTNLKTGDWRRVRNVLTPLLSGQKLKQLVIPSLDENKRDLIGYLTSEMERNNNKEMVVDMMDLSTRSGVDGFCLTAFGLKTDSLRSGSNGYGFIDSCHSYLKHMNSLSGAAYSFILKSPWIMKYLFGKTFMKTSDHEFFSNSCKDIADNRIDNKIQRSDYLQLLQALRNGQSDDNSAKSCSEVELISQCFEFYESVITEDNLLTTFVTWQLSQHSDIQQRLYDECAAIKSRIGDKDLTYEILNEMKYAEMIIYEGLRMCRIAPELKRRATKAYVLENSNGEKVTVQPGDAVWLPAFILQNDPQYYPNPSVFDPERFSEENRKSHVSGTYAPFGLGPRDCIGCQYPLYEMKATLYYLLLSFEIQSTGTQDKSSIKLKRRI